MAKVVLARIDSRLIHGQVITKWLKRTEANRIIVIDNNLAKDQFMLEVYSMAAPANVKVQILCVDDFITDWDLGKFANDRVLLLFKDVDHVFELCNKGFILNELQIGGLGDGAGRVIVYKNIGFNAADIGQLKELISQGVHIFLQPVPEDKIRTFEESIKKVEAKIIKGRKRV